MINKFISTKCSRWFNKLFANINGYFWLPCPLCGQNFGGHEWNGREQLIMTGHGTGTGVCHNCIPEAIKYNKEWNKNNPGKEFIRLTIRDEHR